MNIYKKVILFFGILCLLSGTAQAQMLTKPSVTSKPTPGKPNGGYGVRQVGNTKLTPGHQKQADNQKRSIGYQVGDKKVSKQEFVRHCREVDAGLQGQRNDVKSRGKHIGKGNYKMPDGTFVQLQSDEVADSFFRGREQGLVNVENRNDNGAFANNNGSPKAMFVGDLVNTNQKVIPMGTRFDKPMKADEVVSDGAGSNSIAEINESLTQVNADLTHINKKLKEGKVKEKAKPQTKKTLVSRESR